MKLMKKNERKLLDGEPDLERRRGRETEVLWLY